MNDRARQLALLHEYLGYKPLSRGFAKVEILLGLAAVGAGLWMVFSWSTPQPYLHIRHTILIAGLALFVLGGYLTLAGHRSHLYQSNNELTAYLAALIQRSKDKGSPE